MDGSFKEINYYPVELQFTILSPDEIKKMSVVEVVSGLTFDQLGRPLPGGLYDPLMGSYGRCLDPCATCLNTVACPGHIGHIKLNAVMNNPFFTQTVYSILKMSCIKCFRLQITSSDLNIIMLQLKLVDAGYIIEAQELEFLKSGFSKEGRINSNDSTEKHPILAEVIALLKKGPCNINCTKTSNAIRSSILHTTLQISAPTKCIHCKQSLRRVRMSYKKLVVVITKEEMMQLSNSDTETSTTKVILADECRDYLREIYKFYGDILKELFPILKFSSDNINYPTDLFFMEIIPVTPPKTRPTNVLQDQIVEHPQTVLYRDIIEANAVLRVIFATAKGITEHTNEEAKNTYELAKGSSSHEKVYYAWQSLQENVDQLLDAISIRGKSTTQGLKQLLEKKEGLIRKHMMGKRVNFAARTVITPDPNINVEEVGVPDIFAKKLSYPVPVTSWNVSKLRKMILNGPDIHPGANYIEDERGRKTIIPANDPSKRESYSKLLLTNTGNGVKIVHRHLLNGDVLLLNRQPTLHKPSIMAHKARILKNEKTFRLHYSNCKSYNADFDGDEMNAHFPQSEDARSEAYNIANVENQYLVPKDGTPLGGLIQDHVISGVKLSIRGRFFNKEDYQQLVFQGLSHVRGNITFLPPAIIKPKKLWSGKQILSTIIINLIPEDYPAINLTSVAKISPTIWRTQKSHIYTAGGFKLRDNEMSESEVVIRNGELLVGVLDKQQYGATQYGLVHCMYELYGGTCSTRLLTSFTKLFTNFLQREGFTLGVHDILVTSAADEKRRKIIKECRNVGISITAAALDLEDATVPTIAVELEKAYINNPKYRLVLDRHYKSVLDKYTNEINKVCLPTGLISQFPLNNLQLMVLSGAKGSMVNTMQISCLLGQIELEGKRPPLMISGKSLPSFASFETSPKSGGFIDGRFMTGIQPQEFFFHCMAGREGLIDTAVKTSRSGYLQRCLIKHLEGLTVNYDLTVRDSDNSVVQFMYGEDGMDISKSRFFNAKCLSFLDENSDVILHVSELDKIKNETGLQMVRKLRKKIKSWKKHHGDPKKRVRFSSFQKYSEEICNEVEVQNPTLLNSLTGRLNVHEQIAALWINANKELKDKYKKKYSKCPDPIVANLKPDNIYGAINENIEDLMNSYVEQQPHRKCEISDIIYIKSIKSMAAPGEAVGLLAAQSVGEPSTQMTLNTFHFAGRGEMNVTLGIPRLREILMLASSNIKTPSMDIPFLPIQLKTAEKLRIKLNQVTIADTLQHIKINSRLICDVNRFNQYTITFTFLPRESYQDDLCVKPKQIIKYMSEVFFKTMFKAIGRASRGKSTIIDMQEKNKDDQQKDNEDDEGNNNEATQKVPAAENDESSGEENEDDGTTSIRLKSRKQDETEYDDLEEDEEVKDILDEEDQQLDEEALDQIDESFEDKKDEMLVTVMNNDAVNEYDYDKENYLWCKITFNLPLKYKKVDMSNILKQLCEKSVVHSVERIKRAITYMKNDDMVLKTDGINIKEMFKYNKLLDLNRLYCNDIHAIAQTYGIEAAARVIVKEVQTVFGVYGITVDPRHLLLIADYMTFDGTFKPLSRKGMEHSASPLQQMSFESCLQFLKSAIVNGRHDDLCSPSSRLMVGLPGKYGTGLFSLLTPFS